VKITEIIPAELSGFCDIATGECVDADTETPDGTATEDNSQRPEVLENRPAEALSLGRKDVTGSAARRTTGRRVPRPNHR